VISAVAALPRHRSEIDIPSISYFTVFSRQQALKRPSMAGAKKSEMPRKNNNHRNHSMRNNDV